MVLIYAAICALFVFAQASLVFVRDPAYVLLTRQIQGTTPPQCNGACQSVWTMVSTCTEQNRDPTCGCSQATGEAEQNCVSCLVAVDPGGNWGAGLTAFSQGCNYNPPLTIAPYSTAAPSGTSPNPPTTVTQSSSPSSSQQSRFTNTTVSSDDPRISTSGPNWMNSTSSCDSSSHSKTNNVAGQTLTFQFTGSAVYMSTAQFDASGQYSVGIDDQSPVTVDGFSNSQKASCGYGWSASKLQNALHTVVVTTMGQSPSAASGDDASNFELDGFVITQADANSGASSDAPLTFNVASGFGQFVVLAIITQVAAIYA